VAGGVDDVHGRAGERERHDRGADGDAAAALERERVGLGGPRVHRAEVVDDPGVVQEAFGQGRLAGVNVRQDPQVERACGHA